MINHHKCVQTSTIGTTQIWLCHPHADHSVQICVNCSVSLRARRACACRQPRNRRVSDPLWQDECQDRTSPMISVSRTDMRPNEECCRYRSRRRCRGRGIEELGDVISFDSAGVAGCCWRQPQLSTCWTEVGCCSYHNTRSSGRLIFVETAAFLLVGPVTATYK